MPRNSLKKIQESLNSVMEEQRRDRDFFGKLMFHSTKTLLALEDERKMELARLDAELLERRDAINKLFDHMISQEEERRELLTKQLEDLDATPSSGHNEIKNKTKPKLESKLEAAE